MWQALSTNWVRRSGRYRARALLLAAGLAVAVASPPAAAAEAERVKIALFDFELRDTSGGGGIIGPDPIDVEHLAKSTEEARRMLSESGLYTVVDTGSVADEVIAAGGVQHCRGCDGRLARELGADQSMVGLINRVSRTEYTLKIVVRDAQTGETLSEGFTGLRLGANYAWPRGVIWLLKQWLSPAPSAE
jgi:hypothetical protein